MDRNNKKAAIPANPVKVVATSDSTFERQGHPEKAQQATENHTIPNPN